MVLSALFLSDGKRDATSCSPFRVPIARPETGRAVLGSNAHTSDDDDIERSLTGSAACEVVRRSGGL